MCRYPNYAGELLTWWSLWGLCAPSLSWTKMSIALVSPAVVTFLLTQVPTDTTRRTLHAVAPTSLTTLCMCLGVWMYIR